MSCVPIISQDDLDEMELEFANSFLHFARHETFGIGRCMLSFKELYAMFLELRWHQSYDGIGGMVIETSCNPFTIR